MKAYLADHPETRAYQDHIAAAPLPDSFANSTYYSINAFRFIDGAGSAHAGRRAFEPEAAFGALDKAALASLPTADRKSVVQGKSVSVRVDLGCRRIIKKTNCSHTKYNTTHT